MTQTLTSSNTVVVVGGGPAGLTAAYLLSKAQRPVIVLESDPEYLGGISRTERYKGFRFDIGGHRFFSKSQEIENLWTEILGDDLIDRPRLSRIYYNRKFFSYPLKAGEALNKLGIFESIRCGLSYLQARMHPTPNPKTFEDWVVNQFGRRLFEIFFKTYTEKVWGVSCKEISSDWAAQRIKNLSLGSAIKNAILPKRKDGPVIKTLIDSFRYPRLGPGMMWERCAEKIEKAGGSVLMGYRVTECKYMPEQQSWVVKAESQDGRTHEFFASDVINSAPMGYLPRMLAPPMTPKGKNAAESLRYRDFLTVALVVKEKADLPDNWIYIHDAGVKVGRVQNFKSWSPEMIPDPSLACYGLEYFCFEGDGLWTAPDEELIALAKKEIGEVGLADPADVLDGCVVRQRKAYPVYDATYNDHVQAVRDELAVRYPGFHVVGRNGMHKYNNQDHSMMTAILTARNILAGEQKYDVWNVNQDAEYHEGSGKIELREVPTRLVESEGASAGR